jgi:hypothetical protein
MGRSEGRALNSAQSTGSLSRLASGAFLVRDYETALDIGRLTQQESMAKAWPRMMKLAAQGGAVFVTEGGATVQVLEQRHAVIGPGVVERLVRVRFVEADEPELAGEFWMTAKALEGVPAST